MAELSCRRASIILCWAMLVTAPTIAPAADDGLPTFDETFLTLDRLPALESPEERLAAYESALRKMAIEGESWALPSFATHPNLVTPPLTLDRALDEVAPAVVLIDPGMRAYFAERPAEHALWEAWRQRHALALLATVEQPGYGPIEIYGRAP